MSGEERVYRGCGVQPAPTHRRPGRHDTTTGPLAPPSRHASPTGTQLADLAPFSSHDAPGSSQTCPPGLATFLGPPRHQREGPHRHTHINSCTKRVYSFGKGGGGETHPRSKGAHRRDQPLAGHAHVRMGTSRMRPGMPLTHTIACLLGLFRAEPSLAISLLWDTPAEACHPRGSPPYSHKGKKHGLVPNRGRFWTPTSCKHPRGTVGEARQRTV